MTMNASNVAAYVGSTSFEKVRTVLSQAFGSASNPYPVSDDAVAAAIEGEWAARSSGSTASSVPALSFLPDPPPGWSPPEPPADAGVYYNGSALHERSDHEVPHSAFVGVLPMARVALPAALTPIIASTTIGYVFATDHLLPTVPALTQRMVQLFGNAYNDTARVDLITPCRMGGRFGAIGVYLCYRGASDVPSYYVLEAGLATGAPVRLYFSSDMGAIRNAPTAYFPSPFVEPTNSYDGVLSMDPDDLDEPTTLIVSSFREPRGNLGWRVRVTVSYGKCDAAAVSKVAPGDLTLTAAERIAAIATALGESDLDFQTFLAASGKLLKWNHAP